MNTFFSFVKYCAEFRFIRAYQTVFCDERKVKFQEFVDNPPSYFTCRAGIGQSDRQVKKGLKKIYSSWENSEYFTTGTKVIGSCHRNRLTESAEQLFGRSGLNAIIEPVCGRLAQDIKEDLKSKGYSRLNGLILEHYHSWSGDLLYEIHQELSSCYDKLLHPAACPSCKSGTWCMISIDDGKFGCDECESEYIPTKDPLEHDNYFGKFMAICAHEDKTGIDLLEQ